MLRVREGRCGARRTFTSSTTLFDQQATLIHTVAAMRHGMVDCLGKRVLAHLDPDARKMVHDTIDFLEEFSSPRDAAVQ